MKKRRGLGFSLIEILIALALVGVTMGLTLKGYGTYNRRQTVTAAAKRIRQVLNEAKANATAYRIDCSLCGGGDGNCDGVNDLQLVGWEVGPFAADRFRVRGQCGSGPTYFMPRIEIFNGITFTSAPAGSAVIFKPGGAGTNLTGNLAVTATGWGYSETVTVNPGGLVQ